MISSSASASSSSTSTSTSTSTWFSNNKSIFQMSQPPPTEQPTAPPRNSSIWNEIKQEEMMTLEDFLAKAQKIEPQEDLNLNLHGCKPPSSLLLQRQKRMIKNRESAARSRQRKQAYQSQLESLVLQLEQNNRTLSLAKTEQSRIRYKQLMDNVIPVTEKRRPSTCRLRKVRSMEW